MFSPSGEELGQDSVMMVQGGWETDNYSMSPMYTGIYTTVLQEQMVPQECGQQQQVHGIFPRQWSGPQADSRADLVECKVWL